MANQVGAWVDSRSGICLDHYVIIKKFQKNRFGESIGIVEIRVLTSLLSHKIRHVFQNVILLGFRRTI